jgi:hypothetical protein
MRVQMRLDLVPLTLAIALMTVPLVGREAQREVQHASEPKPLPLALDDSFEIRKVSTLRLDPRVQVSALSGAGSGLSNSWLQAEMDRRYYGAISSLERKLREGHYYNIQWSSARTADVKLRFEYRQEKLGLAVQLMEMNYPKAKGSYRSEFSVIGDDYHQDGVVTAWRITLVENGSIVGVNQSFLW